LLDRRRGPDQPGIEEWAFGQAARIPPHGAPVVGHGNKRTAHPERAAAHRFNGLRRNAPGNEYGRKQQEPTKPTGLRQRQEPTWRETRHNQNPRSQGEA
jgi:hypothetical protein